MLSPLSQSLSPLWTPPKVAAATLAPTPGMALWWESNVGVYHDLGVTLATNGQTVAQWDDQSGNGYHATIPSGSGSPTYVTSVVHGLPTVRFSVADSGNLSNRALDLQLSPFTAFVVGAMTGTANHQRILTSFNNWLLGFWNGGRQQAYYEGSVNLTGSPAADTTFRCYSGRSDFSSYGSVWENGSLIATSAGAFHGPNAPSLGGRDWSEASDCDVAEVILYSTALSDSDRAANEAYLSAKYALGF